MTETITVDELKQRQAAAMSEAGLQEYVRKLAESVNALYYHTHRSQHSPAGFPDVVIVTQDGRLIFAELKRQSADPTPAQEEWLEGLREVADGILQTGIWEGSLQVHVWRPLEWLDGTIKAIVEGEST